MSNTKDNILAYSKILSNKKDNVPSGKKIDEEPTAQQKVSVYNPTSSESHKQMVEDVEQKAIAKAEENKDNPPSFDNAPRTYGEMLKRFYREKIKGEGLTPEQREKREMRLAKIQDGISAIANLIAATQGAQSSYTGQNTRTENTRKKWEEFYNKREEEKRQIYEDQMRALKLEEAIRNRNKDIEEDEKPTSRSPIQRESEVLKQEQQLTRTPIQRESEVNQKTEEDNPQKIIGVNAQQKPSANGQKEVKNELLPKSMASNNSSNKTGGKSNGIGFIDDKGNEIVINKDIWKGSMQQVFNVLIDDGVGRSEHTTPERYKKRMSELSNSQKEDFVKMNWNKSKKAKDLMFSYSKKNPPTMTSKISDEEEIEIYTPNSNNDDDVIVYVPGKK